MVTWPPQYSRNRRNWAFLVYCVSRLLGLWTNQRGPRGERARLRPSVRPRATRDGPRARRPSAESGSACSARRRWSRSVQKSTSVSGARGTGIDAIEQASRRWRGGRRDDSARTRRNILIPTQRILMVGLDGHVLCGNQPVNLRKLTSDLTSTDIGFDLTHPDMQE